MFIYHHIILTPFFLVIKVWTKCKLLIIRQSTSRFLSSARYIVDIQIYTIYSVHTGQSAFALNLLFSTSYLTLLLHSKSFIMNTFESDGNQDSLSFRTQSRQGALCSLNLHCHIPSWFYHAVKENPMRASHCVPNIHQDVYNSFSH